MKLDISDRLKGICKFIPEGAFICDIGCDHALLPVYLLLQGAIKGAIAADIAKGPLLSAKENIEKYDMQDKILLRQSDGFDNIKKNESNCIIIAGMGGLLMLDILRRGEEVWKSAQTLILSPHRDIEVVREYMSKECLYEDDIFIKEKKTYYPVMKFAPQKKGYKLDRAKLYYGLNPNKDYLLHSLKNLENILDSISKNGKTNGIIEKENEIKERLDIVRGLL